MKKDLQVITLRFERDMFGQILFASQIQRLDLEFVLSHVITPAPLSIAHINGAMCSTPKSKLSHHLLKDVEFVEDVRVDVVYIDFMFYLISNAPQLPSKYSDLAKKLILIAKNSYRAKTIVFVCDVYTHEGPNIKDLCRVDRGVQKERGVYPKIGYEQKRPNDFIAALKVKKYVVTLLDFLQEEFGSVRCQNLLAGISLHFSYGPCFSYKVFLHLNHVDKIIKPFIFNTLHNDDCLSIPKNHMTIILKRISFF